MVLSGERSSALLRAMMWQAFVAMQIELARKIFADTIEKVLSKLSCVTRYKNQALERRQINRRDSFKRLPQFVILPIVPHLTAGNYAKVGKIEKSFFKMRQKTLNV